MGMDWGFYNSNFMEHRDSNTASVLEKLAGTESSCHFLKAAAHFITISRVSGSKAGIFLLFIRSIRSIVAQQHVNQDMRILRN